MSDLLIDVFIGATVVTVLYCLIMILLFFGWFRLKFLPVVSSKSNTKVSIIVPVRNEETNIVECLHELTNQNYDPSLMEIVVVDDHSTDRTISEAKDIAQRKTSHAIRIIATGRDPSANPSKKIAITTGVKNCEGEIIITTDADCRFNTEWLRTMMNFHLENNSVLTAGPVLFTAGKGMFDKILELDYCGLTGVASAGFGLGFPLYCSGSNLMFNKRDFISAGGYSGNETVASGDDVFLLQRFLHMNKQRIFYIKNRFAAVSTSPPVSWSEFLNQRSRWASKAIYYKNPFLVLVSLTVFLCNLLIFILFVPALLYGYAGYWAALLVAKSTVDMIFLVPVTRYFGMSHLLKYFLPAEALHIFYVTLAVLFGLTGNFTWKNQ